MSISIRTVFRLSALFSLADKVVEIVFGKADGGKDVFPGSFEGLVLDFDDGLAIVGLKYIDEEGLAEEGKEPEKEYELVRCTFFAYDKLEDFDDRKELAEDILRERRKDALRELGMRLITAAKVEFPYGDGIFRKRPPKKKVKKNPAAKKPKDPSRVKKSSEAKRSPSTTNAVLQVQKAAPPVDLKK